MFDVYDFTVNIRGLVAGDDWSIAIPLAFIDSAGVTVPAPAWLGGDAAKMDVRLKPSSASRLVRFSTSPGAGEGLIELTAAGLTVSASALITAGIAAGTHEHDIEFTRGGLKTTFARGAFEVVQKITRG